MVKYRIKRRKGGDVVLGADGYKVKQCASLGGSKGCDSVVQFWITSIEIGPFAFIKTNTVLLSGVTEILIDGLVEVNT